MYKKDLVSVIIPFHNAEKYVEKCIECLKAQEYKDVEAIFVDDGSDDKTSEIIGKCSDSRVKLISLKKSGVSTARNVGIQNATGEYITFWDIDDMPHPDFISTFVDDIHKYNVDTVVSNYEDVFVGNKHVEISLPWENQVIGEKEISDVLIPRMIYPMKGEKVIRGLVWRTFTYTKILVQNNLYFDPDISLAEDLLFTIELYKLSKKIYIESRSLYDYIRNGTSSMNSRMDNVIEKQVLFHQRFAAELKRLGIYEKNQKRYAANKMNMYSVCISACVRNGNVQADALKNLNKLRRVLLDDDVNILQSDAPMKIKVANCLLLLKMYSLLIMIYALKEKRRISKYN